MEIDYQRKTRRGLSPVMVIIICIAAVLAAIMIMEILSPIGWMETVDEKINGVHLKF